MLTSVGPWGNQGATNQSMQLSEDETINEIIIRHGFIVDSIEFTVASGTGKTRTAVFGGQGGFGVKLDKVVLRPNEYITHLSGWHGQYEYDRWKHLISSIKIHTNLNPMGRGYGPYGQREGIRNTCFFIASWSGIIRGFYGRVSQYLESIGVFVNKQELQKFGPYGLCQNPPNWEMKLGEGETIKEITVGCDEVVVSLGFTTVDRYGEIAHRLGGSGGRTFYPIDLKPDEHITRISGIFSYETPIIPIYLKKSAHVDHQCVLTFMYVHTNLNPSGYGPYGLSRGDYKRSRSFSFSTPRSFSFSTPRSFSFSTPEPILGGDLGGFFGSDGGGYLESLGVYMKIK